MKKSGIIILLLSAALLGGCAGSPPESGEAAVHHGTGSVEEKDSEEELISAVIHARGICQNYLLESMEDRGLFEDIRSLMWLVPRGALGAEESIAVDDLADNVFLAESDGTFGKYASEMETDWYFDCDDDRLWIRLNYRPYQPPEGVNVPAHKDILLYVDGEDLYFAVQDAENEKQWEISKIPGYGSWMEKETEMFYRLYMGL